MLYFHKLSLASGVVHIDPIHGLRHWGTFVPRQVPNFPTPGKNSVGAYSTR